MKHDFVMFKLAVSRGTVKVNRDQVKYLLSAGDRPDKTYIYFGKDDSLLVDGTMEAVSAALDIDAAEPESGGDTSHQLRVVA